MKIPDLTIQKIKETADVLEVIGDYVTLKKVGQSWWALSPFTDEKTPSFCVTPSKGIFKCFSSGKGGDAISFVMQMEGMKYIEALRHLAKKYGIEVEGNFQKKDLKTFHKKESMMIAINFAKNYYHDNLNRSQEGKNIAINYLNERKIYDEVIKNFELGYSLSLWNSFFQEAKKQQYKEEILEAAGLIVGKQNSFYDRFRGRIMFPIHNLSGKVIGFGARTLEKGKGAKYINSPESEVYHKSDILYGLFQAKNAIRKKNNCYLVEGYTDVIALHQAGIEHTVASAGTSLTTNQIKLIQHFTKYITILYDGDIAGIKASLRNIDLFLEKGLDVKVVLLPKGEDPDSYIQKIGGESFKQFLKKNVTDFVLFKIKLLLNETKNSLRKRTELILDIKRSIEKISDEAKRNQLYRACSKLLGVDKNLITDPTIWQEQESIRILIEHGDKLVDEDLKLYNYLLQELEGITFKYPLYREILEEYQREIDKGNTVSNTHFIEYGSEEIKKEIERLTKKRKLSENWYKKYKIVIPEKDENLNSITYTNLLRLKFRILRRHCQQSLEDIKAAKTEEEFKETQLIYIKLKKKENMLAKELGMVVS